MIEATISHVRLTKMKHSIIIAMERLPKALALLAKQTVILWLFVTLMDQRGSRKLTGFLSLQEMTRSASRPASHWTIVRARVSKSTEESTTANAKSDIRERRIASDLAYLMHI